MDVPRELLGDGDAVPDKYKLKPVPMVYGHVDRSPTVISSSPFLEHGLADVIISVDRHPISNFVSGRYWHKKDLYNLDTHPLWVFRNDAYLNVWREGRTVDPAYEHTGTNYFENSGSLVTGAQASITITPEYSSSGGGSTAYADGKNAPGNNFLDCNLLRIPITAEIIRTQPDDDLDFTTFEAHKDAWTNLGNLTKHNMEPAVFWWELANAGFFGEASPVALLVTYGSVGDDNVWYVRHHSEQNLHMYNFQVLDGDGEPVNDSYLQTDLMFNFDTDGQTYHSFPYYYTHPVHGIIRNEDAITNSLHNHEYPEGSSSIDPENFIMGRFPVSVPMVDESGDQSLDDWDIGSLSPNPNWWWRIRMNTNQMNEQVCVAMYGVGLYQQVLLDKYNLGPFYAHIIGRTDFRYNETDWQLDIPIELPCDIIYHIIGDETGRSFTLTENSRDEPWEGGEFNYGDWVDTQQLKEARAVMQGWKMAFAVDKTINSKKLIEGIGAESRCFPYLKGDTLSFNVIKDSYEPEYIPGPGDSPDTWILPEDFLIKADDAIQYSFNRTSIDDIKTKVVLHYHYDYAEDNFSKSTEDLDTPQTAQELYEPYQKSLYNIEGDQGNDPIEIKYIRHQDDIEDIDQTIVKLKNFILGMNCNQHILCTIRLPLSYLNAEVGDITGFRSLLGNSLAYGIDYSIPDGPWYSPVYWHSPPEGDELRGPPHYDPEGPAEDLSDIGEIYKEEINGQVALPYWLVTEVKKTLEYVELKLYQLHKLDFAWSPRPQVPSVIARIHPEYTALGVGGDVITLDGTHSHDPNFLDENEEPVGEDSYPDNGITAYLWTQISGPSIDTYNDINGDSSVLDIELPDNYSGENITILFALRVFNAELLEDTKIISITNQRLTSLLGSAGGGVFAEYIPNAPATYWPTHQDAPRGWMPNGAPQPSAIGGKYIVAQRPFWILSRGQGFYLHSHEWVGGTGPPLSSWMEPNSIVQVDDDLYEIQISFQDPYHYFNVTTYKTFPYEVGYGNNYLWSKWRYIFKGTLGGTFTLDVTLQGGPDNFSPYPVAAGASVSGIARPSWQGGGCGNAPLVDNLDWDSEESVNTRNTSFNRFWIDTGDWVRCAVMGELCYIHSVDYTGEGEWMWLTRFSGGSTWDAYYCTDTLYNHGTQFYFEYPSPNPESLGRGGGRSQKKRISQQKLASRMKLLPEKSEDKK